LSGSINNTSLDKLEIVGVEKANFLHFTPKSPSLAPPKRLREGAGGAYLNPASY